VLLRSASGSSSGSIRALRRSKRSSTARARTGTPAQAFGEAQSKRALDLAARFVEAAGLRSEAVP
jgi:hypothetical protein